MKQEALWRDSETFVLTSVEMFNWGGFQGLHRAPIDGAGTAVIGPTGSGKTTLVDALMTLICASPRYNLASTGVTTATGILPRMFVVSPVQETGVLGSPTSLVLARRLQESPRRSTVSLGWFGLVRCSGSRALVHLPQT